MHQVAARRRLAATGAPGTSFTGLGEPAAASYLQGRQSATQTGSFIGVNVGALVGHCALRRTVMGDDSVGHEATASQIAEMVDLLRQSIEAGALGFSTTQSYTHSDGTGQPVPSRWSSRDELLTLCRTVSEYEGTTLEWVTDGCMSGFSDDEVDLIFHLGPFG